MAYSAPNNGIPVQKNRTKSRSEQSAYSEMTANSSDTLEINLGRVCKAPRQLTWKVAEMSKKMSNSGNEKVTAVGKKADLPNSSTDGLMQFKERNEGQHLDSRTSNPSSSDSTNIKNLATFKCCGMEIIGATELHNHLQSERHIYRVCSENKMFRCLFCNRFLPQDVHGWKRHLNFNKKHRNKAILLGGKVDK